MLKNYLIFFFFLPIFLEQSLLFLHMISKHSYPDIETQLPSHLFEGLRGDRLLCDFYVIICLANFIVHELKIVCPISISNKFRNIYSAFFFLFFLSLLSTFHPACSHLLFDLRGFTFSFRYTFWNGPETCFVDSGGTADCHIFVPLYYTS